jgi:hypothetical protein
MKPESFNSKIESAANIPSKGKTTVKNPERNKENLNRPLQGGMEKDQWGKNPSKGGKTQY